MSASLFVGVYWMSSPVSWSVLPMSSFNETLISWICRWVWCFYGCREQAHQHEDDDWHGKHLRQETIHPYHTSRYDKCDVGPDCQGSPNVRSGKRQWDAAFRDRKLLNAEFSFLLDTTKGRLIFYLYKSCKYCYNILCFCYTYLHSSNWWFVTGLGTSLQIMNLSVEPLIINVCGYYLEILSKDFLHLLIICALL